MVAYCCQLFRCPDIWKGESPLMKKVKKFLALLGAFLLAALYISTLVFALSDSPVFSDLLKISVAATILVPVLLYACILVARLNHRDGED